MLLMGILGLAAAVSLLAGICLVLARAWRSVTAIPGGFRCKIAVAARGGGAPERWSRHLCRAVWIHDVLIVWHGLTRTRVRPYAVHFAEGAITSLARHVRGLGASPVVLALQTDDGTNVLLAAPRAVSSLVAGPFLAALVWDDRAARSDRPGG